MRFQIPGNLGDLTARALRDYQATANTEYTELLASVTDDTVTDEQIADLRALRDFCASVDTTLSGRTNRAAELSSLPADLTVVATPVEAPESAPAPVEPVVDPIPEVVTASATPAESVIVPSLADIVEPGALVAAGGSVAETQRYGSLVAAADVPTFSSGVALGDYEGVAKAFLARTASYRGLRGDNASTPHGVAILQREGYGEEFTVTQQESDQEILLEAIKESRLPQGSLVASAQAAQMALRAKAGKNPDGTTQDMASLTAAVGWCAPSMTNYETCLQVTTSGLADFPEVVAPRGGIRHNVGIDWNGIWSGGSNFFNYTEAQIISGQTKPCMVVDCPSFVDTRLGVTGLCITGNVLQNRAYPEYVATFVRGAMAVSAHQVNMLQIAAVVTGSTAVDLTASAPFVGDGTVVSQVMAALDMAQMDIKYRLRLDPNASLEVKLPFWLLAQFRADWSRRNAADDPNLTDALISQWFAVRNINVQFVYDWQDAFASGGAGLGNATPLTALPTSVVFLMYPTGTWVRAVSDVISLSSIYDSAKLATNQVTQLFVEQGWAMVQMCNTSRAYTLNICPSGETGAQRTSTNTIVC